MNKILQGDCIEKLKELPDNSVDAIITDPPYELGFMGKHWDNKGIAYKVELWKEALRVLKPGGFLLAFGGTRTYHRLACGIEDAGFEIRDCIQWLYGSGFPKSLNIGKAVDKLQGNERESLGTKISRQPTGNAYAQDKWTKEHGVAHEMEVTKGTSEWEGWGTSLKPANEPIVVARKPLSEKNVALNVLKWGTGGINIDACKIGTDDKIQCQTGHKGQPFEQRDREYTPREYQTQGRFPANIILECTCNELKEGTAKGSPGHWAKSKVTGFGDFGGGKSEYRGVGNKDNMKCVIHTNPNCPCYMLDEQSGVSKSCDTKRNRNTLGSFGMPNDSTPEYSDKGGASRFFYCAKASKSERNFGCEGFETKQTVGGGGGIGDYKDDVNSCSGKYGSEKAPAKNNHPTVKPIKLMEYLIKLVTKEGAIVLDPFLGSGTTAIACLKLNRKFIGIEKEPEYIKIAEARIKPFMEQKTL